ncbi:galanin receptor 2a-like [Diadema setosum]|uniref:galanin receptor 2a-like n=1 Tax=Diadema setosum TaxID=31175 RepID=UPI003B3ABDE3
MENVTNDSFHYADNDADIDWVVAPLEWTWRTIIQLILAILGVLGNLLVICVYVNRKRMKSCTNVFIVGLAVADLITSIHQFPYPVATTVPNTIGGELYCRIIFSWFTMWSSIIASVFTLTLIACERYVAVVYAVHYRSIFSNKRSRYLLMSCWVGAIVINTQSLYISYPEPEGHECIVQYPTIAFQRFIGLSFFLVEFILPMAIMLFTQVRTIRTLRRQAGSLSSDRKEANRPALSLLQARRRVIEMFFIVIITFIICWLPDQILYFCYMMGILPASFLNSPLYQALVVLAFANSCINPFIYAARNSHFRHALRDLILRGKRNRVHSVDVNTIDVQGNEFPPDTLAGQGGASG